MESASNLINSVSGEKDGFIGHVFSFNDEAKGQMLNIIQYSLLALIPSIIILKIVKNYSPEEDDSKGSIEISVEVLLQLLFMVLAIYFINKSVLYIPTYSGSDYLQNGDLTIFLLPFIILLLAMKTKIGAKINILYERIMVYIRGEQKEEDNTDTKKNRVRVSQPLAGQHIPSQADTLDISQLLPSNLETATMMPSNKMKPQESPDFSNMYNSQMPSNQGSMEPAAANDYGGSFGNW